MNSKLSLIALAGCLLGAFLVYSPGLSGGFIFDDFANIVYNPRLEMDSLSVPQLLKASSSGESGLLGRPISMLSFALNLYAAGPDPYIFKLTNVVVHLLNGLSVYVLVVLLLKAHRRSSDVELGDPQMRWVGVAVAAVWLLHPLNLTSVLYIVQRMTSLSALFVFWGLILYAWGRLRILDGKRDGIVVISLGLLVCGPLAVFAKESGALLPVYMLVVEFVLFRFHTPTKSARNFLFGLFGLSVALPALALLVSVLFEPRFILGGYAVRDFTLAERLMTEARVLWFYVQMIAAPSNASLGMYHDDISISRGMLDPASTLFAVVGWAVLVVVALVARRRAPVASFGLLFFLAGHSMESSFIPLEIAHEHRNYVPSLGIFLLLLYYLLSASRFVQTIKIRRFAAIMFVALCAVTTLARAGQWSQPLMVSLFEVEYHPNSPRTNYEAGRALSILLETGETKGREAELYSKAKTYYENALALKPEMTETYVALINLSFLNGQPVDPVWLENLERQLRSLTINPNISGSVSALFLCHAKRKCQLSNDYMQSIVQSVTSNSTLDRRSRAILFTTFADFYRDIVNDHESALDYSKRAMESAPHNLVYRVNYANLLILSGRKKAGREQLALIESADRSGSYASQISELRSRLGRTK